MAVLITELLGRADTGISVRPFICRTEEGRKIYVKPAGVLRQSLIAEWLGGRMAEQLGLPCAEISLVEVPELLAHANRNSEWSDFQAGIGFGSYALGSGYRDLQASDLKKISPDLLAVVYVFDYWIRNRDRQMGLVSGNPNTLVSHDVEELCLIDHDSAFDVEFDLAAFKNYHLSRAVAGIWRSKQHQSVWLEMTKSALDKLEVFWNELPESWLYSRLDNSDSPIYTIDRYREILELPFQNSSQFWEDLIK